MLILITIFISYIIKIDIIKFELIINLGKDYLLKLISTLNTMIIMYN